MQIIRTYGEISEIIVTDEEDFNVYRRLNGDKWERLMGTSWEILLMPDEYEEIERLYQELNE